MKRFVLVAAALSCTACTSLQVHEFNPAEPSSAAGLPYPLPFTQYRVELVRQVVGCGPKMKVAAAAKVEETRSAPDPLHRYVIDPNSLGSALKTSEVKLEYHPNGLVKSLNATAEDKTGELIANIGAIGVKIATLAAAPGGPAEACSDAVLASLAALAVEKPKLAQANADLETKTAELKRLKDKITALGTAVDEATKTQLSRAHDALTEAVMAQKAATARVTEAAKGVTHRQTVHWPENGDVGKGVFLLPPAVLAGWTRNLDSDSSAVAERSKLDIYMTLHGVNSGARTLTRRSGGDHRAAATKVDPDHGIPFRQPEYGLLEICTGTFCEAGGIPLTQARGDVLQLGQVYYLPCVSRPFTSVGCTFELTEAGWLKSIGTAQKEAALVGATGAVKTLLGDAVSIQSTLAGASTASLEAKTKELQAEKSYRDAVAALVPQDPNTPAAQLAALTTQVELARARINLIEAEAELASQR